MRIKLTKGYWCRIDAQDSYLARQRWCASITNGGCYAVKGIWNPSTKTTKLVPMHRIIVGAKPGQFVDHINGNTLDNRRRNLQICTNAENIRKMRRTSKGVHFQKARSHLKTPWLAYVGSNGSNVKTRRRYLGYFATRQQAQVAYNNAAKKLYGKFFLAPVRAKKASIQ